MDKRVIAVMDSGVGGISTLLELKKEMPNESFIYFGDNVNAPYGSKSQRELIKITLDNLAFLLSYNPKAIVFACNTLSVSVLNYVREFSPVKIFGVYPPIESQVILNKKTVLIATPKTVERIRTENTFCNKYLVTIPLEGLAEIVENKFTAYKGKIPQNVIDAELDEGIAKQRLTLKDIQKTDLILGCTHYVFVKNQISDHLKPLRIVNGNTFTAKKLHSCLSDDKISNSSGNSYIKFVGKNCNLNSFFYSMVVKGNSFIKKN